MRKNTAIIAAIITILFLAVCTASCRLQTETTVKNDNNDVTSSTQTTSPPESTAENNSEPGNAGKKDNNDLEITKIDETDPAKGEYFIYAVLISLNEKNKTIEVEQLINEPNEKEIEPVVTLADNCQVVKIILDMQTQEETFYKISLTDIKLNSEIGIIFNSDNKARAIILQELK